MPLFYQQDINETTRLGVWKITEDEEFDEAEAQRFEALMPFRDFVMNNYRIVRTFGPHVLFELNTPPAK